MGPLSGFFLVMHHAMTYGYTVRIQDIEWEDVMNVRYEGGEVSSSAIGGEGDKIVRGGEFIG